MKTLMIASVAFTCAILIFMIVYVMFKGALQFLLDLVGDLLELCERHGALFACAHHAVYELDTVKCLA